MRKRILLTTAAACLAGVAAQAQDNGQYVPKAQYDQLLKEHEQMKRDMEDFKAFMRRSTNAPIVAVPSAATPSSSADVQKDLDTIRDMARRNVPGTDRMMFGGYGSAGYQNYDNHGGQAFSAQFNPIFLWKLSDKLLFEGEVEMELEDGETSTALEIAQLSYVANDYVTFGAGKFLNPMNAFVEKYHMAWVNRLPDKPLAVYDGLLPETYVGAQVHGGIPLGPTKFNYAIFVGNAPTLTTSPADPTDPSDVGTLGWDNFDNAGNHLAYGGHLGFQPVPELEIGYGVHFSEVGPMHGSTVNALLQSVDASYVRDSEALLGVIRINAQWVWSHVDRFDYGPGFGRFNNTRDGGYFQFAYRPTHVNCAITKNFEGVFRYDILNQEETPVGFNEERYTIGLNYWLSPMTVFKAAYQFDRRDHHEEDNNGVLLQFATGF